MIKEIGIYVAAAHMCGFSVSCMAGFGQGTLDWADDALSTKVIRALETSPTDYTDLKSLLENLEKTAQNSLPGDGEIISKRIFQIQSERLAQIEDLAAFGEILTKALSRSYQVVIMEGELVCIIVLLMPHIDLLSEAHSVNQESYLAILTKGKLEEKPLKDMVS